MSFCPRCVQPVPSGATQCPSCGYDTPADVRSELLADQVGEVQPGSSVPPGGSGAVAATPSEQAGQAARVPEQDDSPIAGFTGGPAQVTNPPEKQRRSGWVVVGAGVAVLALIAVLVAGRIGHRGGTNATAGKIVGLVPTDGVSRSGAASSAVPGPGSTRAANRQPGRAQASAIASYLTRSGQARHGIGASINAISGCRNIASAVTTLHNAAEVRSRILTALPRTSVSALPHGAVLRADLGRAMQASANADRHYAAWGQAVAGCHGHPPRNTELAAAQRSDTLATAFKRRFANEWNPIAASYGLPEQNASTI